MHADGQAVADEIDGVAPGAWRLPLPPLSATSLPEPFSPGAQAGGFFFFFFCHFFCLLY